MKEASLKGDVRKDPDGGAGCQGLGEGRAGSVCVMGMEFQFEMLRRVPGKAGGDVCTTGGVYFIPWNCVRKMVNLTQYACSQLKKKTMVSYCLISL